MNRLPIRSWIPLVGALGLAALIALGCAGAATAPRPEGVTTSTSYDDGSQRQPLAGER